MARVKRGVIAGARHKKILKKAKGYYNARRKVFRAAKQAVIKAGQYAYRGRRLKKRDFRALWIKRITAAAREFDLSYSRLINGLKKAGVDIDRKMLADLAMNQPAAFAAIAQQAKAALDKAACFGRALLSGEAPKDLDARREETLGAISGARDPAALEEVRVR